MAQYQFFSLLPSNPEILSTFGGKTFFFLTKLIRLQRVFFSKIKQTNQGPPLRQTHQGIIGSEHLHIYSPLIVRVTKSPDHSLHAEHWKFFTTLGDLLNLTDL